MTAAYEALARSFHADRYRLASEDDRRMAQEIFDSLAEAHRVLHDPALRRAYSPSWRRENGETPSRPSRRTPGAATVRRAGRRLPPTARRPSLYEVGLEHLRARRHHEAVEVLRQAARLSPTRPTTARRWGGRCSARRRPTPGGTAAIAELRRATQIDERNRRAAQHLAEIYAQTGQPEAAVQELERLLALDPGPWRSPTSCAGCRRNRPRQSGSISARWALPPSTEALRATERATPCDSSSTRLTLPPRS